MDFEWEAQHLQFIEYAAWAGWGLDKAELTEEQLYATIEGKELEDRKHEKERLRQEYAEYINDRKRIWENHEMGNEKPNSQIAKETEAENGE